MKKILLRASLVCWLISLALPALLASRHPESSVSGLNILILGWLGFAGVKDGVNLIAILAWWANPLYLIAFAKLVNNPKIDTITPHIAVFLGLLTFLLSSYAINAVPSFTTVTGYGPGVMFWLASLLLLGYSSCLARQLKLLGRLYLAIAFVISLFYITQICLRYAFSNQSEKAMLPAYAAKRGRVCSVNARPLKIPKQESIIEIDAINTNNWISTIHSYGIDKIQANGHQYRAFNDDEKNNVEARKPPYMYKEEIITPARYLLKVEGYHPYKTKKSSIRMVIMDTKEHKVIGELIHNPGDTFRYCPTLPTYSSPQKKNHEEVIQWLAPFISHSSHKPN
ncbi:MAG: hypothetical protein V3U89_02770 [Methylophilaceae bacterium]